MHRRRWRLPQRGAKSNLLCARTGKLQARMRMCMSHVAQGCYVKHFGSSTCKAQLSTAGITTACTAELHAAPAYAAQ